MIRLVCIVEIPDATTVEDAQLALDAFRERTQDAKSYDGLTIYRATKRDAEMAYYMPGGATPNVCDECGATIPPVDGGSLDNKHHEPSCSLYDAEKE